LYISAAYLDVMPKMKVMIELPNYELDIENKKKVIDAAGKLVRDIVVDRTESGKDAKGQSLHRPKDGGKPLNRTGQLLDSITWKPNKKGDRGVVRPTKGRKRTKSPTRGKKRGKIVNNAGLTALLAVEDRRQGSDRPAMVIMDTMESEKDRVVKLADRIMKVDLKSKSTRKLGS